MKIEEFIGKEWTNITPYLFPCMNNMGDGTEWQVDFALYIDTDRKSDTAVRGWVAIATADGIELNREDPRFEFKLIRTRLNSSPSYAKSDKAFMIMARKKEV